MTRLSWQQTEAINYPIAAYAVLNFLTNTSFVTNKSQAISQAVSKGADATAVSDALSEATRAPKVCGRSK
jgi:hypothetical protein